MEIPLFLNGDRYDAHTIDAWQSVWDKLCKMAYEHTGICESIVTCPGILHVDGVVIQDKSEKTHSEYYENNSYMNSYFLTLDNIWKQYSQFHNTKMPEVVPELKELKVPIGLYYELGIEPWFRHSFPNCIVTFWER